MQVAIEKSNFSRALSSFHYDAYTRIDSKDMWRPRDIRLILEQIAKEVKERYRDSKEKHSIRQSLKAIIKRWVNVAEGCSRNNRLSTSNFLYKLFNGIIISDEKSGNRYDIVIQNTEGVDVWLFKSDIEMNPTEPEISHICKSVFEVFGKKCLTIFVKGGSEDYSIQPNNIDSLTINETFEIPKTTNINSNTEDLTEDHNKIEDSLTESLSLSNPEIEETQEFDWGYIGSVRYTEKEKYILSENKKEAKGWIKKKFLGKIDVPGDIVILENPDSSNPKIWAKVIRIETFPLHRMGQEKSFSEIGTPVFLEPILECFDGNVRSPKANDLSNYKIRFPNKPETRIVENIPKGGLPIGIKQCKEGMPLIFNYPLSPEDTIYQSVLISGVQGSGKTNFVKLLIRALSLYRNVEPKKRPATIILDGEGEYQNFTNQEKMVPEAAKFLKNNGLSASFEPRIIKLSQDPIESTGTLSLEGIKPENLIYLLPELSSKTESIVKIIIRKAWEDIQAKGYGIDIQKLRNHVIQEVNSNQLLHREQPKAIARAFLSPNLDLLDQEGCEPILLNSIISPGEVTVINIQNLSSMQKRAVAQYLLLMFDHHKMEASNKEPGLNLIIDESELHFPKKPSKFEKEYVCRIEENLVDITRRGRKRKYGLILVTHLPSDVSTRVSELCNTKIAFRYSGADNWVTQNFGKEYLDEIKTLPTGTCRINTVKTGIGINTQIKIPYVDDPEKLPRDIE